MDFSRTIAEHRTRIGVKDYFKTAYKIGSQYQQRKQEGEKMIRRLFNLVQKPSASSLNDQTDISHYDRIQPDSESAQQHRNDATRPSYRVGKHKISDIYKALDMGG